MLRKILVLILALGISLPVLAQGSDNDAPSAVSVLEISSLDTESEVRIVLKGIDETLISYHVGALQDFKTRDSNAPTGWDSAEFILSEFQLFGLQAEFADFWPSAYTKVRNVVATLPGANPSSTAVFVICAHYDSAHFTAPGADDNGSGTAAVLAAAQALSQYRFNHTIKFVAFGAEEDGLVGSSLYAQAEFGKGTNISGVLNLDMIGYNPDPGTNLMGIHTDDLSENLANYTTSIAQKYYDIIGLVVNKSVDGVTYSDHASFWSSGYSAIMLAEDLINSNPHWHMTTDTIENMNLTYAANITQMATATIFELAGLNETDTTPPVCSGMSPAPGGYGNETPIVSLQLRDGRGINATNIGLWIDGAPSSFGLSPAPLGLRVSSPIIGPYSDGGIVNVRAVCNDTCGNTADVTWNFTVDAVPPLIPDNISLSLDALLADDEGLALNLGADGGYNGLYDSQNLMRPSVVYRDGEYKMWYTGDSGSKKRILYANSSDGISWEKHGLVLDTGLTGDTDQSHAAYCSVIWSGGYVMWYSGHNGTCWRIMRATSPDGITWTKGGVSIDIGSNSSQESNGTLSPTVILDGAMYKMWYVSWDLQEYRICFADSPDGVLWTKSGPVLECAEWGALDFAEVSQPCVAKSDGKYWMWYTGWDGSERRILEAVSIDGMNWTRRGICIESWTSDGYSLSVLSAPGIIFNDSYPTIFYSGQEGFSNRIFRAGKSANTLRNGLTMSWNLPVSSEISGCVIGVSEDWSTIRQWAESNFTADGREFTLADVGEGEGTPYYFTIASVDRVGHVTRDWRVWAKVSYQFEAISAWGLIGDPFNEGQEITRHLSCLEWDYVLAYLGSDAADHWKTNYTMRLDSLDDLTLIGACQGLWVHATPSDYYVPTGLARNLTVDLYAGWNLIASPFPYTITCSELVGSIGPSCTIVEGFDPGAEYLTSIIASAYPIFPARGYWVYMTSATTWQVSLY